MTAPPRPGDDVIRALAAALHLAYEVDETNPSAANNLRQLVSSAKAAHDALRDENAKLRAVADAATEFFRRVEDPAGLVSASDATPEQVATGLRWGEAAGLRWSDYDEATGEISVSRGNWKGTIVTPKTPGSYRSVPFLPEVAELITRHKKTDLLFHTRAGTLHRGYPLLRALAKACEKAGVPHTTVHGLRRSFNNHGRRVTSGSVLRAITGHADESMTDHYSTIDVGEKAEVARSVANAIGLKQAK